MIPELAAGYRAVTGGNDNFGFGNRVVCLFQSQQHIPAHAACDQNAVGMTRRSDKLNAKPAEVIDYCAEHIHVRFTGIAACGADFPQFKRPPKKPA